MVNKFFSILAIVLEIDPSVDPKLLSLTIGLQKNLLTKSCCIWHVFMRIYYKNYSINKSTCNLCTLIYTPIGVTYYIIPNGIFYPVWVIGPNLLKRYDLTYLHPQMPTLNFLHRPCCSLHVILKIINCCWQSLRSRLKKLSKWWAVSVYCKINFSHQRNRSKWQFHQLLVSI